ncbi:hypothetical protein M9H77_05842 [Catharanthus roseus]|uniref:Uncharacterized protein n=1 Tax=Catharanthus roseus TaxID=4058 RepID=A0ACC0BQL9_CATRO|nr:hypothetical protein M9H77_05842 [Catharanthus roseus]
MAVALTGTTRWLYGGSRLRFYSSSQEKIYLRSPSNLRISCLSAPSELIENTELELKSEYKPGLFDDLFLHLFRSKMVQETGWDSGKPGYDGLIEVANRLMIGRTNSEAKEASIRVLRSLFPPLILELYRILVAPLGGGRVAAEMVARVTALTCKWLMGPCEVNTVDLHDETSWTSGVLVERCKYLEESKCVGICINTCKLPTQSFFKDYMGVNLVMEPNFSDYSCQLKFGVLPPQPENDSAMKEPCLEICPNATPSRRVSSLNNTKCPKA